ncbi:MAG: hypothetical protein OCD76_25775, partial [Reichenbachiella sp.]
KHAELEIKESLSTLKDLRGKQTSLGKQRRVYALICLKESKFTTRQELANHLGVNIRSLEKWVFQYKASGLEDLLLNKPRRKGSKIITSQIHQGLEERAKDPANPFKGYWDAQQWANERYNVNISYHWLRKYMIQHFETKVKRPRKSHINKDPLAADAFFKTTQHIQGA